MTAQNLQSTSLDSQNSLLDLLVEEGYSESQFEWEDADYPVVSGCLYSCGGNYSIVVIVSPRGFPLLFQVENLDSGEYGEYRFDSWTKDGWRGAFAQAVADGFFRV